MNKDLYMLLYLNYTSMKKHRKGSLVWHHRDIINHITLFLGKSPKGALIYTHYKQAIRVSWRIS